MASRFRRTLAEKSVADKVFTDLADASANQWSRRPYKNTRRD